MAPEPQAVHKQDLIRQVVFGVMPSTLLERNYFSVSEKYPCIGHVGLMEFSIKLEGIFS